MQQEPIEGMGWRYVLFMVLSTALVFAFLHYQQRDPRKQPAKPPVAKADAAKDDGKTADGKQKPESGKADATKPEAAKPGAAKTEGAKPDAAKSDTAKPAAAGAVPETIAPEVLVTLGSVEPDGPYRSLYTLTSRGAGVLRAELSSLRFLNLEDRSGYLGHVLGAAPPPGPKGCVVQVVGAGTPAEGAGLRPGDIIQAIGDTPVADPSEIRLALSKTKPKQQIDVTVLRNGKPLVLTATLRRRPLEVIHPESGPPSFLLTLYSVGDESLAWTTPVAEGEDAAEAARLRSPDTELDGVRLRKENWEIVSRDAGHVTFRRNVPKHELEVRKTFRLKEVPEDQRKNPDYPGYHLTLEIEIRSLGKAEKAVAYQLEGPNGLPTEGAWYAQKVQPGLRDVWASFAEGDPEWVSCPDIANKVAKAVEPKKRENPMIVLADDAQYFTAAVVSPDGVNKPADGLKLSYWQAIHYGQVEKGHERETNTSFRLAALAATLPPKGSPTQATLDLFAGPRRPDLLQHYGLGAIVDYGWFGWVARPLLAVLHGVYKVVPNYGFAIIALTVLVRLCMFPISLKQAHSSQKMQLIQPEMKKIQEKYKNDLEGRGRAMRELYKKHNFHPASGCLPLFIQLPIFIGLYRALMVDVELRQAPLIAELIPWASNAAAPDMLLDWSAWMPNVLQKGGFLIPTLGPYLNILPLITVALYLVQQKIMMPPALDDQARMQQKMMKYMMVFIGIMFYRVASGLCLYFIASTLWSLGERRFLPKSTPPGQAAATASPPPDASTQRPSLWSFGRDDGAKKKKKKNRRR